MPRLAILNMLIGFAAIFFAAAAGPFIATSITEAYLRDKELLESWLLLLQRSAHGHTNLFGLLHISFGLTMPYSVASARAKLWQTVGFAAGTFAMGPLMLWRAVLGPIDGFDLSGILIGVALSAALVAVAGHVLGLGMKLLRRE